MMYLLAKFQELMLEGRALERSLGRLLTTRGLGNLGFQKCNAQDCSLLLQHSWFSTNFFFSFLLRVVMLSEGADCCPGFFGSV